VVLMMDDVVEYHEERGKRIIQKLPVSIKIRVLGQRTPLKGGSDFIPD
jgi:hypothetical protein